MPSVKRGPPEAGGPKKRSKLKHGNVASQIRNMTSSLEEYLHAMIMHEMGGKERAAVDRARRQWRADREKAYQNWHYKGMPRGLAHSAPMAPVRPLHPPAPFTDFMHKRPLVSHLPELSPISERTEASCTSSVGDAGSSRELCA